MKLEELLAHANWTRRLARGLVSNEALADDIAQKTLVSVLSHPPANGGPVQPWLRRVARNHVIDDARETRRRAARERRADEPQGAESPEDVLGRLDLHKVLVEEVSRLVQPYRHTILLRYFEGLTSTQIAARENIPAGTVRGRLKTGVELLREALDRRRGGREQWMDVLGAFCGESFKPAGAALGVTLAGGLKALVAALVLFATGAVGWRATRDEPHPAPIVANEDMVATTAAAAAPRETRPPLAVQRAPIAVPRPRVPAAPPRPAYPDLARATPPARAPTNTWSPSPTTLAGVSQPSSTDVRCTVADDRDGPVWKACSQGGRSAARKLMKKMVDDAKKRREKLTCDGCHKDLDTFALTPNAREDFKKLETILARPLPGP